MDCGGFGISWRQPPTATASNWEVSLSAKAYAIINKGQGS